MIPRHLAAIWCVWMISLVAVSPLLFAADWEGLPVVAVQFQPQNSERLLMPIATLQELIPQKTGQPFRGADIRESIHRLFATGRFADVQADAQPSGDGVSITFLLKSRYFIGLVNVQSDVSPPSTNQLHNATQLRLGQLFDEAQIQPAVEGLRRILEQEGYFQPRIEPHWQPNPQTQQVNLDFVVQAGEQARIGQVIVTGNSVLPPQVLIRQANWDAEEKADSSSVEKGLAGIRKYYQDNDYLAARLLLENKQFHPDSNRVDLQLNVEAGSKVLVTVTGASVSRSQIRRLIPVYEEGMLDEDLMDEGTRNLASYFESQGYFDSSIQAERESRGDDGIVLNYRVNLGTRQRLRDIRLEGNSYFQDAVLLERMQIEPARWTQRHGRFSTRLLERDLATIRALYQANGFLQAVIMAALEKDSDNGENELMVTVQVQEGPQMRVGNFNILGARSFSPENLQSLVNVASGQPYSESLVAADREAILNFYFNAGFPSASFQWTATPSEAPNIMDMEYVLEEGEREYISNIFVDGLEFTRRGIVNRQLQFGNGSPLSQSALLDTQRRLYDLGIFTQVEMAIQNAQGQERQRNVLVYMEEAPRYTVRVGLGADVGRFGGNTEETQEVEGAIEISPNISFDATKINVGGRPHTLGFRSRFSSLQKRSALTYIAPRLFNNPWLNGSARAFFDETRDVRTFTARRWEGSMQFEMKKGRSNTFWSRYAFRRITVDTDTLRISENQIPILSRSVLVGFVDQNWARDTRDNPTNTQRGSFTNADAGVASSWFGSQADFTRFVFQNSTYHLLGGRVVLARSFQLGLQAPFGEGRRITVASDGSVSQEILTREIPIAERFFAGGGNSHRGFAVNQAGPRDPETGFALGGNALLMNNVELRFPVWGNNLGAVLFHDAGNIFARIKDLTFRQSQRETGNLRYVSHALGFGLRYQTPVGPIRFDLGRHMNPPSFFVRGADGAMATQSLSRWQFLVSIGQSF